jgi:Carbohydrate-binding module 48 (Isoamylase N-terminal domain)
MPAEPEFRSGDDLLQRVVDELRRPVSLDSTVDAIALERIRRLRRPGGFRQPFRLVASLAAAAVAAGVLLAVLLPVRGSRAHPELSGSRAVHLRLVAPTSSRVVVVGDFNNWDPGATPLRSNGREGIWTVELRLKPGRYHYTFLVDGRTWVRDPAEPPAPESDFGAPTSVLTVS